MERIRTMTDARKHASLWAATALLAVILLFLCGGKVFAQENNLDIEVTEIVNGRPPQVQKEGTPLGLNKKYAFELINGEWSLNEGNTNGQKFYIIEFSMNGKTFSTKDVNEDAPNNEALPENKQPDFMTYIESIAGGEVPNCRVTFKKAGTLTVKATIYRYNKVFKTVVKTFKIQGNQVTGTTQKPKQPTQPASLKKGTKVTDKKSKAVYKVNGNKTVEYNKADKKAKKATVPSTITVNGVKYQVTSIAAKAFANNKKLTKVVIPASVRSIGKQAFSGCKNLKDITIQTPYLTKKSVGAKAFKGIHTKATIKVPKKQKKAYQKFLKTKGIGKKVKIK